MFLRAGRSLSEGLKSLINHNDKTFEVLDKLVDELHNDKELAAYQLLNHPGSEDILWGIIRLLASKDPSIAGHAAYVVGTLCDIDVGRRRILEFVVALKESGYDILTNLTSLLFCKDGESIMNATGTIGTLAETSEGRSWLLRKDMLDETLTRITALLGSDDIWTASNAALVIARLTIEEEGCARILNRRDSKKILLQLINSLGNDEAGRGMNSAFAIGRLCDMESGRRQMLMLTKSNQMLVDLTNMLCSDDAGCIKNACFALGCIAGSTDGVIRLLNHSGREIMFQRLANLLNYKDDETAWFAAMTIRTMSSKKEGCLLLRDHKIVKTALKDTLKAEHLKDDIKEEFEITLEILKHLQKPKRPIIKIESSTTANVRWAAANPKSGLEVTYKLYSNDAVVYSGLETSFEVKNLTPTKKYTFKLKAYTEGDQSPVSDGVSISMPESVPSAPQNLHVVNRSATQLKIGWETPESPNGIVRGYQIFQPGKTGFTETQETSYIFINLIAGTEYIFEVYALTSVGRGEKAVLNCETVDLGMHAPPKPILHVLGRNEILVQWDPPEEPLGRINYYEVKMNDQVIYTGIERNCTARRLLPKTEYTFTVAAWTNEGKCESECSKKKTAKEKRVSLREPLYPFGKRTKSGKLRHERGTSASPKTPPKQRSKSVTSVRSPKICRDTVDRPKTSVQIPRYQPRQRVAARMNVVQGYNTETSHCSHEKEAFTSRTTRRRYFSTGSLQSAGASAEISPKFATNRKQSEILSPSLVPKMRDSFIGLSFRSGTYSPVQKAPLKFSYSHNDASTNNNNCDEGHEKAKKSVTIATPFSRALNDLKAIHSSKNINRNKFQPIQVTSINRPGTAHSSKISIRK